MLRLRPRLSRFAALRLELCAELLRQSTSGERHKPPCLARVVLLELRQGFLLQPPSCEGDDLRD